MSEQDDVREQAKGTIDRDRLAVATAALQGILAGCPARDAKYLPDLDHVSAVRDAKRYADEMMKEFSAPQPAAGVERPVYVGIAECGCIIAGTYDLPDLREESSRAVGEWILSGLRVERRTLPVSIGHTCGKTLARASPSTS